MLGGIISMNFFGEDNRIFWWKKKDKLKKKYIFYLS